MEINKLLKVPEVKYNNTNKNKTINYSFNKYLIIENPKEL